MPALVQGSNVSGIPVQLCSPAADAAAPHEPRQQQLQQRPADPRHAHRRRQQRGEHERPRARPGSGVWRDHSLTERRGVEAACAQGCHRLCSACATLRARFGQQSTPCAVTEAEAARVARSQTATATAAATPASTATMTSGTAAMRTRSSGSGSPAAAGASPGPVPQPPPPRFGVILPAQHLVPAHSPVTQKARLRSPQKARLGVPAAIMDSLADACGDACIPCRLRDVAVSRAQPGAAVRLPRLLSNHPGAGALTAQPPGCRHRMHAHAAC